MRSILQSTLANSIAAIRMGEVFFGSRDLRINAFWQQKMVLHLVKLKLTQVSGGALLIILTLLFIPHNLKSQIANGGIAGNFGIDADNQANMLQFGSLIGADTDDWFKTSTFPGTGVGVIDTSGTPYLASLLQNPGFNGTLTREMAFPYYSVVNGRRLIYAIYGRDYFGGSGTLDSTIFKQGSKNGQDPLTWNAGAGNVQGKNDLIDIYGHMRRDGLSVADTLWFMAGSSIRAPSGNRYLDFEFFSEKLKIDSDPTNGDITFSTDGQDLGHSQWEFFPDGTIKKSGDLIISVAYLGGGTQPVFEIRIWVSDSTFNNVIPADFDFTNQFDGPSNNSPFGYAQVVPATGAGLVNISPNGTGYGITPGPPWGTTDDGGNYSYVYNDFQYAEATLNVTNFGLDPSTIIGNDPCKVVYESMLVKTRASASFTAALKDFAGPYQFRPPDFVANAIPVTDTLLTCYQPELQLTVTPITDNAYYTWWTLDGNIISNPDSATITVDRAGTYFMAGAPFFGCGFILDTLIVAIDTVKPQLNTQEAILCKGGSVQLSVTPAGSGYSVIWTGPNGFTSTDFEPVVIDPGLYYATMTLLRNGCTRDTVIYVWPDNDCDGLSDPDDIDDDNDGIPDWVENHCPTDASFGTPACLDPSGDDDGDGIFNWQDPDFCTLNAAGVCEHLDTDKDGIIDEFDLDSDNDGIPDLTECQGVDVDGDGVVDVFVDTDNDGLADMYDPDNGGNALIPPDSDTDLVVDMLDLDSDNDGIPDVVEADGTDENGDGIADDYVDSDRDGYNDVVDGDVGNDLIPENSANSLQLTGTDLTGDGLADFYLEGDTDMDGLLDQLDLDSDNDGIPDVFEAGGSDLDFNGLCDLFIDVDLDGFNDSVDGDVGNDGIAENVANALIPTGPDANGNGAPDSYPNGDYDGDGLLNFVDLDSDGDLCFDAVEGGSFDYDADGIAGLSGALSDPNGNGWLLITDATEGGTYPPVPGPGPDFLDVAVFDSCNLDPIATNDTVNTNIGDTLIISVLNNDHDPDGTLDTTSLTIVNEPDNGTVTIDSSGNLVYVPDSGFVGVDTLVYMICDQGSPVPLCDTAIVIITVNDLQCVAFSVRVLMEGPYIGGGAMRTDLNNLLGLLPGQTPKMGGVATPDGHPYNRPPWGRYNPLVSFPYGGYDGSEGVGFTDADYSSKDMDWVLFSLRTSPAKSSEVFMAAALLTDNGDIRFVDPCPFTSNDPGPYFIVVEHRNHMAVMSPVPVLVENDSVVFDFTIADSWNASGASFGQKEIDPGVWVMFGGDVEQSSDFPSYDISGADFTLWILDNGLANKYLDTDFTLDGDCSGVDGSIWYYNNGYANQVQK